LREKLISEQTDRIRQQNSNQEKVNAARNAGSSINGAPAGNRPTNPTPNRSLRDELAANLRAATSGRI
jgi:hypothetical protein